MEDFRNLIAVENTFEINTVLNENYQFKRENKLLLATSLCFGVIILGVTILLLNENEKNKASSRLDT